MRREKLLVHRDEKKFIYIATLVRHFLQAFLLLTLKAAPIVVLITTPVVNSKYARKLHK